MDCEKAADLVVRRIYRETSGEEERDLYSHLAGCPTCREMEQDYRAIVRILDREKPQQGGHVSVGKAPGRSIWDRRYMVTAIAACFLIAVAALHGFAVRVGPWGFAIGGEGILGEEDVRQLVKAELEGEPGSVISATLDQLRETVAGQNEVLAYLLSVQERDQILTARTFEEVERQIRAMWGTGPAIAAAYPAQVIYSRGTGPWRAQNHIEE